MTITREDLEMAAKAAGLEWQSYDMGRGLCLATPKGGMVITQMWHPGKDDGDCARMCAAVGIDVCWASDHVSVNDAAFNHTPSGTWFQDHANDKCAAWRYASVKLAAAVGRAM